MNPFARRVAWLGLTTAEAARVLRVPLATAEAWRAGRYRAPRPALRLLAVWGRQRESERRAQYRTRLQQLNEAKEHHEL